MGGRTRGQGGHSPPTPTPPIGTMRAQGGSALEGYLRLPSKSWDVPGYHMHLYVYIIFRVVFVASPASSHQKEVELQHAFSSTPFIDGGCSSDRVN